MSDAKISAGRKIAVDRRPSRKVYSPNAGGSASGGIRAMKISTKGRYGLRILADIALHQNGAPRLIREIAESQGLSQKYVGRIIIGLRRGGLLKSMRGAHGGYRLARRASEINLLEVFEATEGKVCIIGCAACPKKCARSATCAARPVWELLNENIKNTLAGITLEEVIKKAPASGGAYDYCI